MADSTADNKDQKSTHNRPMVTCTDIGDGKRLCITISLQDCLKTINQPPQSIPSKKPKCSSSCSAYSKAGNETGANGGESQVESSKPAGTGGVCQNTGGTGAGNCAKGATGGESQSTESGSRGTNKGVCCVKGGIGGESQTVGNGPGEGSKGVSCGTGGRPQIASCGKSEQAGGIQGTGCAIGSPGNQHFRCETPETTVGSHYTNCATGSHGRGNEGCGTGGNGRAHQGTGCAIGGPGIGNQHFNCGTPGTTAGSHHKSCAKESLQRSPGTGHGPCRMEGGNQAFSGGPGCTGGGNQGFASGPGSTLGANQGFSCGTGGAVGGSQGFNFEPGGSGGAHKSAGSVIGGPGLGNQQFHCGTSGTTAGSHHTSCAKESLQRSLDRGHGPCRMEGGNQAFSGGPGCTGGGNQGFNRESRCTEGANQHHVGGTGSTVGANQGFSVEPDGMQKSPVICGTSSTPGGNQGFIVEIKDTQGVGINQGCCDTGGTGIGMPDYSCPPDKDVSKNEGGKTVWKPVKGEGFCKKKAEVLQTPTEVVETVKKGYGIQECGEDMGTKSGVCGMRGLAVNGSGGSKEYTQTLKSTNTHSSPEQLDKSYLDSSIQSTEGQTMPVSQNQINTSDVPNDEYKPIQPEQNLINAYSESSLDEKHETSSEKNKLASSSDPTVNYSSDQYQSTHPHQARNVTTENETFKNLDETPSIIEQGLTKLLHLVRSYNRPMRQASEEPDIERDHVPGCPFFEEK